MRPPSRSDSSDGAFVKPASRPASPTKRLPSSAKSTNRMSVDYSAMKGIPKRSISSAGRHAPPASQPPQESGVARAPASRLSKRLSGIRPPGATAMPSAMPSHTRAAFGGSISRPKPTSTVSSETQAATKSAAPVQAQSKPATSSAALREQIAKAKAAKQAAAAAAVVTSQQQGPAQIDGSDDYQFDLAADPFNTKSRDNNGLLLKRIDAARADGRLNIAAMSLKTIPAEVLRMYDADEMAKSKIPWNETVDLSRLIIADNELETIPDDVFPDIDSSSAELADENEAKALQFRGLESIDLHGNLLATVPVGLKRLERLTTLNLVSSRTPKHQ